MNVVMLLQTPTPTPIPWATLTPYPTAVGTGNPLGLEVNFGNLDFQHSVEQGVQVYNTIPQSFRDLAAAFLIVVIVIVILILIARSLQEIDN